MEKYQKINIDAFGANKYYSDHLQSTHLVDRHLYLPMLFPMKLAIIARLAISIAELPPPTNTAIPNISYINVSSLYPPNQIHAQPPKFENFYLLRKLCD